MLKLTFLLAFLFSVISWAEPLIGIKPLQGDFALSDHMEVTYVKRYEKVDGLTVKGSERLHQLKSDGYACSQLTPSRWLCVKAFPGQPLSDEIVIKLTRKWSGLLVSFREPTEKPKIMEKDAGLEVWSVPQKVFVRTSLEANPKSWDQASYVVTNMDSTPRSLVFLGDYRDAESPSLKHLDDQTLIIQDLIDVSSETENFRYFVDLYISRIQ